MTVECRWPAAAPAAVGPVSLLVGFLRDGARDAAFAQVGEWTEEAVQRITTENTTLKQRVRQLTADKRTLDERLKAARSNLRCQDRRVTDLEARLSDLTDQDIK
ncbi:hypothetical protein [Streptomyces avermitilis]|uniref:hypothetical protein n=1 Tax=Streptomyces avermitilis TaxID=33903 RepID=UPI0033F9D584